MRVLAVLEARPEIDNPCAAPAGVAAAVCEPSLDRRPSRARKLRRAMHGNLIARVQREQLRDMPMARVWLIVIVGPLLNLAMLADRRWRDFLFCRRQPFAEWRIDAENLARANHLRKETRNDLMIHRWPHRQDPDLSVRKPISVFRRDRWTAHETARHAGIFDKIVEKKLCGLFHDRIRFCEERAIRIE